MNLKDKNSPVRFALVLVILFVGFYYFNIFYLGITSPGNYYSAFLDDNLNYIQWLTSALLWGSKKALTALGYNTITDDQDLLVAGYNHIKIAYSCLGLGVMSFLAAFIIAYPKPLKQKLVFFIVGVIIIQLLNVVRFVLLALYWDMQSKKILDHHTIFNGVIYIIIIISIYFWTKHDIVTIKKHETN
jgi:exosortase/archaeosortase family protein